MSVSVVISAYNEEDKLAACLASVRWASEIIVVDNSSVDKTAAVAKKFGAKVFVRPNNPMLNVNKNFGFTQATGDWILNLDADEEIPQALASEIKKVTQKPDSDIVGYWIARKNIIFGKWIEHGLWWPDRHLRLFRKDKGRFQEKHVHEYIEVHGPTDTLTEPFVHHNYETVGQFIRKMDKLYTENEVANLQATNYQLAWYDAIRFPVSDFVKIYFAQSGYKDGLHGLVLALLQAFYSFVVFAKLWEKNAFAQRSITLEAANDELKRNAREVRFWLLTARIRESASPVRSFFLKVQKKLL